MAGKHSQKGSNAPLVILIIVAVIVVGAIVGGAIFLMNGGLQLIFHAGLGIIGRLLTYETYAMNLKREFTDHYDWYLYNLSIKKEAQGKGLASKLMRPMLQFCDDERMVAYLETNKETNVSLYRHYGFDLMREELIPKTPVTHYSMVRYPAE